MALTHHSEALQVLLGNLIQLFLANKRTCACIHYFIQFQHFAWPVVEIRKHQRPSNRRFVEAIQHQSFTVLPSRVRFLLLKYLPASHAGLLIEFHSAMLHPTLVTAVQACAAQGKNYLSFLRELLQFFAEAYERDPEMKAGCVTQ